VVAKLRSENFVVGLRGPSRTSADAHHVAGGTGGS
jgi:hypothetical protein